MTGFLNFILKYSRDHLVRSNKNVRQKKRERGREDASGGGGGREKEKKRDTVWDNTSSWVYHIMKKKTTKTEKHREKILEER